MQRTTFVAQPGHFSMSAMRRILSPAATPTDTVARLDSLQAHTMMFLPSSSSSSSPSMASPPQRSQRKRRGSIAQAASQQIMPVPLSSPPSLHNFSASAPSTTYQSDMYDTNVDESEDDYDCDLDEEDASNDLAMWTSIPTAERSSPMAIPNPENRCRSQARYAATPPLPDARQIVASYLVQHAAGREGLSSMDIRTQSSQRTSGHSIQRSPFAPEVADEEVMPGKPETADSISRKMAYFDEDALY